MKTLLASSLILLSSTTFAHNYNNNCDVNIRGGVSISEHEIAFFKQGDDHKKAQPLYRIVDDNVLMVNQKKLTLTASQQSLVHEYSTSIRQVVPEVKSIALDGINLAVEGVTVAFDGLLGKGNETTEELVTELTTIRDEVNKSFDTKKTLYIDNNGLDGKDFFDEEFEQRIENNIEKAVKKSLGSLLVAVGKEMLLSGGDDDDFEKRMENFSDKLEEKMEYKAANLEKRADKLCLSIKHIDSLENQLTKEVNALANINLLTVEQNYDHESDKDDHDKAKLM